MLRIRSIFDTEDLHTHRLKLLRQRFTNAALVGHDDHAAAGTESDPGQFADGQRRPKGRDRNATRNKVRSIQVRENRRRGFRRG